MDAAEPLITVMTVTRRAEQLSRCLRSVRAQDYRGPVRHLLVVDANEDCRAVAREEGVSDDDIVYQARGPEDVDGPVRLAALRNLIAELAGDCWMTFIDDDNQWEPSHLRSLWSTVAENSADLAHSQRLMFEADGSPYLREEFPWGRDDATRKAVYTYCIAAGIMSPGSNVMRDRLGMRFTWVDLGEWLFPPGFLAANPFNTRYDAWDWNEIAVEDRDLPRAVHNSGMKVAATGQPTLHYFMGGYTNSAEGASVYWRKPQPEESAVQA
jgi:glycosyltransferase involved in cell wall biosynthesis